jgi:hypothetical protein
MEFFLFKKRNGINKSFESRHNPHKKGRTKTILSSNQASNEPSSINFSSQTKEYKKSENKTKRNSGQGRMIISMRLATSFLLVLVCCTPDLVLSDSSFLNNRHDIHITRPIFGRRQSQSRIQTPSRAKKYGERSVEVDTDTTCCITSISRGGDLGGIPSNTLAMGFTGLVSLDAISGTFLSSKSLEWFGIDVPQKSLRQFTVQGIGGMAGGVVVTSLLALLSTSENNKLTLSVEKMVAYGMLSPLLFFLRSCLTNPELTLTKPSLLAGGVVSMAVIALNLFFDLAIPSTSTLTLAMKWIFGVDLALCSVSYYNTTFGSRLSGIDFEAEGELTTQFFRILCAYEGVFSALCLLLLHGVEPVKAIGYTAAVVAAWVFDMGAVTKLQDYLPKKHWWLNGATFALVAGLLGALSVGMLTDPSDAIIQTAM